MRRFYVAACMLVAILALAACGHRKSGGNQGSYAEKPMGKEESVSGEAVSGDALALEQMKMSDTEAFSEAEKIVSTMSLEEKIAQMFLVELSDDIKQQNGTCSVGGIYLTEKDVESAGQAKKMIRDLQASASGSALYIAVEEEGGGAHSFSGKVDDLKVAGFIMPADIGNSMTEDQIYQTASRIAEELRSWGINMNIGPVADIGSSKNAGYKRRCFCSSAKQAKKAVKSYVEGMRDHALATTLKYFPGVGNVAGDYTKEILSNNDSLMTFRNKNFTVYTAGIKAGTDCVMVSNVAVPKITVDDKLPAFLSDAIVTSLLRQELDFEGVIMTSPLNLPVLKDKYSQKELAVKAVEAGCDLLVLPADYKACYEGLLAAVQSGEIDEKVINTSVRRILQDKIQRGIYVLKPEN